VQAFFTGGSFRAFDARLVYFYFALFADVVFVELAERAYFAGENVPRR